MGRLQDILTRKISNSVKLKQLKNESTVKENIEIPKESLLPNVKKRKHNGQKITKKMIGRRQF